ncbi:uncharacterized protein LOC129956692 [Argiope bruennichi]|uniref:uncharacterized protein LOC129956692 n=1 Tax=Argiope bruennichi TaxID=94029 RepID=UPI0024941BB4|nr:uncharacterized protein LOC129956692 [Argiope bruennichi]
MVLEFADDVCLLADSPSELQGMLESIEDQFAQIGLTLNPVKSVAFHLRGRSPVGLLPSPFTVGGNRLKAVSEGELHRFLGRSVGFNACPNYSKLNDLSKLGANILSSALAPWQRLDALKCFFFPALQFPMRTSQFKKTEWEEIDRALRGEIKSTLGLPEIAANEYLFGHRKSGSCGLPVAAEESDLNRIDTAFNILTSKDPQVAELAMNDLGATVRARLRKPLANDEDLGSFLSGTSVVEVFDISNIWACARKASKRLRVTWEFNNSVPRLLYEDLTIKPIGRRKVIFSIRDRLRMARSGRLLSKPDQAKAMECVAQSAASSHFITDGAYTRFADWRFIHKARLNLIPLKDTQAWKTGNNRAFRRCDQADLETLPHVLNHCKGRSRGWQLRQNNIVERIKRALIPRNMLVSENQSIGTDGLRADLVFKNGKKIYIIDVTCPFENRMSAFEEARQRKLDKYASLASHFTSQGFVASVVSILVGSLGVFDQNNDVSLRKFMSKGYLHKFRKLRVSGAIKWSRDIYVEHITDHRQFEENSGPLEALVPGEPEIDVDNFQR